MKDFIKTIIATGNYRLADMELRIKKLYVTGDLTAEDMAELLDLAAENTNDNKEIDIVATLADFEQRISALESKGIKVWTSGMITAKGQTVLYDFDKDGVLDRCRYDGGRATTSSSPGKIEGWVVVDENGTPTHRLVKDENGNIIAEPIATEE